MIIVTGVTVGLVDGIIIVHVALELLKHCMITTDVAALLSVC